MAEVGTAGVRGETSAATSLWANFTSLFSADPLEALPPSGDLSASDAQRSVYFVDGRFSATPDAAPETSAQRGQGLFAAASLIDDSPHNLFELYSFSSEQHATLLASLQADLEGVPAQAPGSGPEGPEGLGERSALQQRSCAATVLLELITAVGVDDETKRDGFALYSAVLSAETHPVLIDNMALHLDRLRAGLPVSVQPAIDLLVGKLAPTKPPYDAWFADGNDRVQVRWAAGSESFPGARKFLEQDGFKLVSEDPDVFWKRRLVFEKTYDEDGQETTVELHLRSYSNDMFKEMDDADAHIQIYTGHSDWGRNVRRSLEQAPETTGENKLVLNELCVGKGELQMMRETFSKADIVTTFNSSHFWRGGNSEGIQLALSVFDGVAKRQDYGAMAKETRRRNPFRSIHAAQGIDNNFLFPNAVSERRKVLDRDHDGQADLFDRVVNFDTFAVAEETQREFQAKAPGRAAETLVGTKIHFAAQTINRLCLFNEEYEGANTKGEVMPGGFFEPQPGETALFRFGEVQIDDVDHLVLTMNSHYAHMSEEAVRMAATFEYNQFKSARPQSDTRARKAVINGLLLAAHSLHTDSSVRDDEVWAVFLDAYGFPEMPRRVFEDAKEAEHHFYAGSNKAVNRVLDELTAEQQMALIADGAGLFRNVV